MIRDTYYIDEDRVEAPRQTVEFAEVTFSDDCPEGALDLSWYLRELGLSSLTWAIRPMGLGE